MNHNPHHTALALAESSLFCLLIARSIMGGVESCETAGTLARFAEPLAAALGRAR